MRQLDHSVTSARRLDVPPAQMDARAFIPPAVSTPDARPPRGGLCFFSMLKEVLVVESFLRITKKRTRICQNKLQTRSQLADLLPQAGTNLPTPSGPVVFFDFDKGVDHGPVSKSELSALIPSGQVNVFQRIEKSIGSVRHPFEMRDLEL